MVKVRIDKWPVTGLAKGALNGKPFALPVGRVVETTEAIAGVLKETSGCKVKVFREDEADEPAKPEPVTVLNPEQEKAPAPAEADPVTDAPPGDDEEAKALAEAEAKAAEAERLKAEKAAAKAAKAEAAAKAKADRAAAKRK